VSAAVWALLRFELALQRRDFFAWLAALVFLLLTAGYASGGPVLLVEGLGAVPRLAPWALAQAMAGVTAFGQVITAITAATTVLRDVGLRTQPLLLTTPLPWRDYLRGRFLGTLATLVAINAAIPLGLLLGATLAGTWPGADALLRPLLVLVLPNVLLVAATFFAAGALSGGFPVILTVGLGFIGCWQSGIALVRDGVDLGALLDPFGNAALLRATGGWDEAARSTLAMPVDAWLVGNRLLWLALGTGLLLVTHWRWGPVSTRGAAVDGRGPAPLRADAGRAALPPLRGPGPVAGWLAEWRFGLRWVTRERGAAALLLLGALNAVANGWRVADDPTALVRALEFHARLFAILVATIYAGELVWRDRDLRADGLLDATPVPAARRLDGRAMGVLTGLLAFPLLLWLLALLLPLLRGAAPAVACSARWLFGVGGSGFALLFVVSLLVHRAVGHKTVAHLLLITAWVAAVALGVDAVARPWVLWGSCDGP
jgi:ABC-2 type transport system permease protein